MSKATNVRKKALDLVRQQDWQGAIREYLRLVEMDQSNPNVHNELADIYLKTSAKAEAYDCFVRAIDEYTRVGLFNNAVAVAKKVMRVLPARTEVLTLLGNVRVKQGLTREAESYYISFLEKVAGSAVDAPAFKKIAREIAEAVPESVPVLHRLSQCLLSFQLDEDAGDILVKVHGMAQKNGDAAVLADVRGSIERLGLGGRVAAAPGAAGAAGAAAATDPGRTVVTEQNIWTQSHSAGERIEIESTPHFTPPGTGPAPEKAPAPKPPAAAPAEPATAAAPPVAAGPSEKELYLLRLARGVGGTSPLPRVKKEPKEDPKKGAKPSRPAPAAPAPAAPAPAPKASEDAAAVDEPVPAADEPATEAAEADVEEAAGTPVNAAASASVQNAHEAPPAVPPSSTATMPRPAPGKPAPTAHKPAPAASKPAPAHAPAARPPRPAAGDHTQISALIDNEFDGEPGEDDYRSHYDLGMAYMEMDLLSEAIREYQVASKSPQFQVKCLEMIGLCFIRQNLPQLAIKQLGKGLSLIGDDSEESLGMKYNLGLAYEMVGDFAAARTQFEDVYVVDVTFRDVAEKVARLVDKS